MDESAKEVKLELSAEEIRSDLAAVGITVSDEAIEKFRRTWRGKQRGNVVPDSLWERLAFALWMVRKNLG